MELRVTVCIILSILHVLIIAYSYHQFSIMVITIDINECEEGTHTCHQNAVCVNTNSSYKCSCKDGYTGNGTTCYGLYKSLCISGISIKCHRFFIITIDINECEEGTHTCHQNAICINTNSSHICSCKDGYTGNGTTCYGLYSTLNISDIPIIKHHHFFYY